MTPVADPGFTGARIAAPQAPRGGVMGGATGGVGGQCPPPTFGTRGYRGYREMK